MIEKVNEPYGGQANQTGINPEQVELEKQESQELQPNIDFYVHDNNQADPNQSRRSSYSETKFIRKQSLEKVTKEKVQVII